MLNVMHDELKTHGMITQASQGPTQAKSVSYCRLLNAIEALNIVKD